MNDVHKMSAAASSEGLSPDPSATIDAETTTPAKGSARMTPGDGEQVHRLREAVRRVRLEEASRVDAADELHHMEIVRLELLREELQDVIDELPDDDDRFELAILPGNPPRFWVDVTGHVTMARDRRTYRFVNDTRFGRVVLLETENVRSIAESVTTYVAERIVERQKVFAADYVRERRADGAPASPDGATEPAPGPGRPTAGRGWKIAFIILGVITIGAIMVAAYRGLLDVASP